MELSDKKKMVVTYYLRHFDKKRACEQAGYSKHTVKDIFSDPNVKAEIDRRMKVAEGKTERNKEWLCNLLEKMIESYYSSNPLSITDADIYKTGVENSELPAEAAVLMDKVRVKYKKKKVKYGRPELEVEVGKLSYAEVHKAQELLSKLRGYIEENVKINMDDDLISRLQKGRERVATDSSDAGSTDN